MSPEQKEGMDSSIEASLHKEGNILCWSLKASESDPELGDCFLSQAQPFSALSKEVGTGFLEASGS